MKLPDVLNVARTFIALQLDGDYSSIKFLKAQYLSSSSSWQVQALFRDKKANVGYCASLNISESTGEVTSFSTDYATTLK